MIITVRMTPGEYQAEANEPNLTASSAHSGRRAAEILAEKVGLNPELLVLEACEGDVATYSVHDPSEEND